MANIIFQIIHIGFQGFIVLIFISSTGPGRPYKDRWQIEIIFKTIKQNLKIKSFFGTRKNAVLTQIWIAMISFLILKYLADFSSESLTVGTLMTVIPVVIFLKKDLWLWLNKPKSTGISNVLKKCQLKLEL